MANKRKEERDDLLTTSEAAEALGVSPTSIKRWADAGRLPALKTAGGHRRYRVEDVEGFLHPEDRGAPAAGTSLADEGVRRLPRMARSEIDALPMGVIQLSDDGKVLLYNATESRFSGIARQAAEGTHFFGELAPCCNNRIVFGRFRKGVDSNQLDAQFDYTFTYRMRPTNVRLHLFRDRETQTNWMTVTPR
jgi:photoactive yellow protein